MTAKEKAKELVEKMYVICQEYTEEIQCSLQAKECAIFAVDGIIENCNGVRELYWQEVKYELEKLV